MRKILSLLIAWCLILPTAQSAPYQVKQGDTLAEIADAFGMTYQQLGYHNRMFYEVDKLMTGQVIDIPERPVSPPPDEAWFFTSNYAQQQKAALMSRHEDSIQAIIGGHRLPTWVTPDQFDRLNDCTAKLQLGAQIGKYSLEFDVPTNQFMVQEVGGKRRLPAYVSDNGLIVEYPDHHSAVPSVPKNWESTYRSSKSRALSASQAIRAGSRICLR